LTSFLTNLPEHMTALFLVFAIEKLVKPILLSPKPSENHRKSIRWGSAAGGSASNGLSLREICLLRRSSVAFCPILSYIPRFVVFFIVSLTQIFSIGVGLFTHINSRYQ
jgi:hypothetical protein